MGPQKIRFEVDVTATSTEIRTGRWRFAEVVDGQALPSVVGSCIAAALGGDYVIAARDDASFPAFEGADSMQYRIE